MAVRYDQARACSHPAHLTSQRLLNADHDASVLSALSTAQGKLACAAKAVLSQRLG